MQFHYVVGYDSETKKWFVENDPDSYFPDGYIFDDKMASEIGYGWFIPEEGSPEEALDYELLKTLGYIVDTFPIPKVA
jgi:hypothetical protein